MFLEEISGLLDDEWAVEIELVRAAGTPEEKTRKG